MTIEQMLFLSRLLLGLTVVGVVASVCLYFLLEINKAIHILTGRTYKVRAKKSSVSFHGGKMENRKQTQFANRQEVSSTGQATAVLTRVLDMSIEGMEECEFTTVLGKGESNQTALLVDPNNKVEMLVDITYVYTEAII
ncbi:MAG: hypothetical protein IJC02_06545 [Lachnospiraceae bacterium]|nr:hypothetical protein [Lachnospiraceae bacterium]